MRESFAFLTRLFRFSPPADKAPLGTGRVCAQVIWDDYQKDSCFRKRLFPIAVLLILYYVGLLSIYQAEGEAAFSPVRGDFLKGLNTIFVYLSVWSSLLLAFLTVDAARRCRDFINKISARPTQYPGATRRHFSRQMGRIDLDYLDEWIDLQLIAELTEQVGQLVYYPAGLVLLLLLARNSWWDCWSWPVSLIIIFIINFVLAFASVVILQRAALDAKRKAEQSLAAKVKKLRAETAATKAENAAGQAEKLLEEIRDLRRGAFVPFWQNPVVGALFLSSGGTTMLQMFIWFMGR